MNMRIHDTSPIRLLVAPKGYARVKEWHYREHKRIAGPIHPLWDKCCHPICYGVQLAMAEGLL